VTPWSNRVRRVLDLGRHSLWTVGLQGQRGHYFGAFDEQELVSGWTGNNFSLSSFAVRATDRTKFSSLRGRRDACGLLPAHGWSMDLFIEERCSRCESALVKAGLLEGE
jgi:hypothetical protein